MVYGSRGDTEPTGQHESKADRRLGAKNRLPAIYARGEFVNAGGPMSYGPSFVADGRDAARLVDDILKWGKPADLPVEQPTKFDLMINLKTAKSIDLTVPGVVLMRGGKSNQVKWRRLHHFTISS